MPAQPLSGHQESWGKTPASDCVTIDHTSVEVILFVTPLQVSLLTFDLLLVSFVVGSLSGVVQCFRACRCRLVYASNARQWLTA